MRSAVPLPGNPWPHDMVITVETNPHALVDLLWIREAWHLQPLGDDLPPLLCDEPVDARASTEPSGTVAGWQQLWPSIWQACVHHAGLIQEEAVVGRLRESADGSAERIELLGALRGPSWRDRFGEEAFGESYEKWSRARFEARLGPVPTGAGPEQVSLAGLIPAWQAGLSKIVTIPCRGSYTRVIGPNALLMTEESHEDPARYGEALALWCRREVS